MISKTTKKKKALHTVCSYLGFLYLTGQQQAASLGVEGASFAADRLVGFPVQSDGSWFPSTHGSCIQSHCYVYAFTKTQIKPKDGRLV